MTNTTIHKPTQEFLRYHANDFPFLYQPSLALNAFALSPDIRQDLFWFCTCASVGQILIFGVMKEYGPLTWITISITRKLFTILLSVFLFNHLINGYQWFGVLLATLGMVLEVYGKYNGAGDKKKEEIAESAATCSTCCGLFEN